MARSLQPFSYELISQISACFIFIQKEHAGQGFTTPAKSLGTASNSSLCLQFEHQQFEHSLNKDINLSFFFISISSLLISSLFISLSET